MRFSTPFYSIRNYSFLCLFILASFVHAQEQDSTANESDQELIDSVTMRIVPTVIESTDIWSQRQTEAFFDGLMAGHLEANQVAGATISLVRNGKVLFAKGYGYSDIKSDEKTDAVNSMFLIGSISKLFTWTAVMQLVEQDSLDLDTDINNYLNTFDIPETFEEPITLRHLMTHTAGFEDYIRVFAKNEEDILPMEEFLEKSYA